MNPSCTLGVAVGLVSLSTTLAPAQTTAPDAKATATTLVAQCVNVKAGDKVLISGTPKNQALLEEIAISCRKAGAFPLITTESEQLARRMFDEVPAKYDSQTNQLALDLFNVFNVQISVDATETEGLMAGADPKRMAERAKADQPVMDAALKSHTRSVSLGNGLFPTAATAKRHNMTLEQLSTVFWSGVNADYSKLHNTGEEVKGILAKGGKVHITNPNGTDLSFNLESPKVFVSDGVVSPEAAAKGGPEASAWLPAGEVYAAPAPGTADGKAVIDRAFYQGKEITGLTLTFKGGKLTGMTAKSGLEPLKAYYDLSDEGKDTFAVVDFGINQSMIVPSNTKLLSWVPAGMVSIGFGDNTWAGGTVKSNFSYSGFIPGSTVTVGGKTLVENGVLNP